VKHFGIMNKYNRWAITGDRIFWTTSRRVAEEQLKLMIEYDPESGWYVEEFGE
jgi:hypothetical protein